METIYERNPDLKFWASPHPECNCGSFALNVTSWFSPYNNYEDHTEHDRNNLIEEMYYEGFGREEIMEAVLQKDQEEILRACPWLEPVLPHEIQPQDRIVAYRIGIEFFDSAWSENCFDDDFHFRLRINGFWFEKNGEEEIRLCPEQNVTKIWYGDPYLIYDSDIVYFRIKDKI